MSHPKNVHEAVEQAADIIELARSAGDLDDPEAMQELVCKHLGWPTTSHRAAAVVIALHDLFQVAPHYRPEATK